MKVTDKVKLPTDFEVVHLGRYQIVRNSEVVFIVGFNSVVTIKYQGLIHA